jgi:hypothetical protein
MRGGRGGRFNGAGGPGAPPVAPPVVPPPMMRGGRGFRGGGGSRWSDQPAEEVAAPPGVDVEMHEPMSEETTAPNAMGLPGGENGAPTWVANAQQPPEDDIQ